MAFWIGRDGKRLNSATAMSLQQDPSYCIVREFDNDSVNVTLRWIGKVLNAGTLPEYWPVFKLEVKNYDAYGGLVEDPVANGQTFGSEKAGIEAYQRFLASWTESTVDHNGNFKEVGNTLVPPPPPDPDRPVSVAVDGAYGIEGGW